MEIKKYRYIDALRWWAVVGVLCVHIFQSSAPYIWFIADLWARGVQLFYIISALTLFLSMGKRIEKEKYPFLFFFIRRFFRIAPLFYICVLYYFLSKSSSISWAELISVITFTNWWHPEWIWNLVEWQWSIAVEMVFYLFVPFLFLKINTIQKSKILLVGSFILSCILIFFLQTHPMIEDTILWEHFLFYFLPAQIPIFSLGIFLYFLIRDNSSQWFALNNIHISHFILPLIIFAWIVFITSKNLLGFSSTERWLPYYSIVFLVSNILMIFVYLLSKKPYKIFVNRITEFLWKISFSMYLTHFIILHYMNQYLGHLEISHFSSIFELIWACALHFLLLLWGTVLVSSITYFIIETPWQLLGKKIIQTLSINK